MSVLPTNIDNEINDYLNKNFSNEDEFLQKLIIDAKNYPFPEIQISPLQAKYLQFLIIQLKAKEVLEVGSLFGYSAFSMAKAIDNDGKITTIEYNPDFAEFIKRKANEVDYGKKVNVVNADGKEYLNNLEKVEKFDFIFIDADKLSYSYYLDLCLPLLKKGGIIAFDNTLAFGQIAKSEIQKNAEEVIAIRNFNQYFLTKKSLFTSFVTIGDGLLIGLKLY